jgi:hypothetical protein
MVIFESGRTENRSSKYPYLLYKHKSKCGIKFETNIDMKMYIYYLNKIMLSYFVNSILIC